jgi:pimeloyl-ACP methyl ester carboxylesterase
MRRARARIAAVPSKSLDTRYGTIEYAVQGGGPPLLLAHGVLGCHADGVEGWFSSLIPPGFRVISPSRFGYFGSALPRDASPADQANAYALLLDHLGVDRAVVMGFSAGSASVLEFARRHPARVVALILASARLGGGVTANTTLAPVFRVAYGAERTFWVFKKLMPMAYARMMGLPRGYRPTPHEREALQRIRELLFPLRPRRDGAVFDGFVGNPVADRFPFEQLTVPTLILSAEDDPLAPYAFATVAARRIPGARLVTIARGGHLFLGSDHEVRKEIHAFVESVQRPDAHATRVEGPSARTTRDEGPYQPDGRADILNVAPVEEEMEAAEAERDSDPRLA